MDPLVVPLIEYLLMVAPLMRSVNNIIKVWSGSSLTKNSIKLSKIDQERSDRARLEFTIF